MSTPHRSILSAGLGRFAGRDPNAQAHFGPDAGTQARELLASSVQKAKEAGFDVVAFEVDPQEPDKTFERFTEQLKSQEWE